MRNYREFVIETMKNPQEAAEYLRSSLEEYSADGNLEAFLIAVLSVAEARSAITFPAEKAELNKDILYKTFLKDGISEIKTLQSVLNSFGFRLSIEPVS